jgi:hypothetical protein
MGLNIYLCFNARVGRTLAICALMILASCATFTDKANPYEPEMQQRLKLNVILKGSFQTQLGTKYATLSGHDVIGDVKSCSEVVLGEMNDRYLKSVLCMTYYNLAKSHDLTIIHSASELKSKKIFSINYTVLENTSLGHQIWSWSNFLTLTIIPYRGIRSFNLRLEELRAGNVLSKASFSSQFVEWRQLFLLPAMPFTDGYQLGTRKVIATLLSQVESHLESLGKNN